jgi:hypothetical protein
LGDIPRGVNPGTRNYTTVSNDFHEPYTQEWSLGVQRELSPKLVLEVRYVGNHVVGNFQTVNANPALEPLIDNGFSSFIPASVTPCATAGTPGFATQRADCNFTNVRNRENTGWSNYNGLQNELRIRNWHGLSASFSYTFSKTLDNSSEIFSTFSGGTTVAGSQDPFDVSSGERAASGLDFPNLASVYFIYELPFFKSQQGFLGRVLGGFQASGTWHYSSGINWTPSEFAGEDSACQTSFDTAFFSGGSTCRPFAGNRSAPVDSVGQCTDPALSDCGLVNFFTGNPTTASAVRWIFNDDVSAAFFGTPYGNVGRNPGTRGQNVNATNFSLFKNIKLNERFAVRLEAQVYNLFNHQFRGVPDPFLEDAGSTFANTTSNGSGGDYTNAVNTGLGRRRMILGAKFTF